MWSGLNRPPEELSDAIVPEHSTQSSQKSSGRAQNQLALLMVDPAHRLTVGDAREIRRAVAICAVTHRTPGETVALIDELAEEFQVPTRAVMEIVRTGGRP
jgi:hypothetical protein